MMWTGRDLEVIVRGAVRATYKECLEICEQTDDKGEWGEAAAACAMAIRAKLDQYNTGSEPDGGTK